MSRENPTAEEIAAGTWDNTGTTGDLQSVYLPETDTTYVYYVNPGTGAIGIVDRYQGRTLKQTAPPAKEIDSSPLNSLASFLARLTVIA